MFLFLGGLSTDRIRMIEMNPSLCDTVFNLQAETKLTCFFLWVLELIHNAHENIVPENIPRLVSTCGKELENGRMADGLLP